MKRLLVALLLITAASSFSESNARRIPIITLDEKNPQGRGIKQKSTKNGKKKQKKNHNASQGQRAVESKQNVQQLQKDNITTME